MAFSTLKTMVVLFALAGLFSGLILVYEEADAAKATITKTWKYGAKTKGLVCGDKLCERQYRK